MPWVKSAACLLTLALAAPTAQAATCDDTTVFDQRGKSDEVHAIAFLNLLRTRLRADDAPGVAALVRYPISASERGHTVKITTRTKFIRHYHAIFTERFKQVVYTQPDHCMFANDQGVMIGNGEIWFDADRHGRYRILTINPAD
ncbi:hypothetical protein [Asticcacaulis solisilvae]|uniref:hypothetical protein n=1 Tax=Asticcacaulis solisilvae TaxID=1217274 RepID=UPI003FD7A514